PAGTGTVNVAVLQLDARAVGSFGGETDLRLAGVVGTRLELPGGADVPAEHHSCRWFVCQDPRPVALGAVLRPVVDVAADLRFEDGLGDRGGEQIVLPWLEVAEPIG